jgi:hypothetical protein
MELILHALPARNSAIKGKLHESHTPIMELRDPLPRLGQKLPQRLQVQQTNKVLLQRTLDVPQEVGTIGRRKTLQIRLQIPKVVMEIDVTRAAMAQDDPLTKRKAVLYVDNTVTKSPIPAPIW